MRYTITPDNNHGFSCWPIGKEPCQLRFEFSLTHLHVRIYSDVYIATFAGANNFEKMRFQFNCSSFSFTLKDWQELLAQIEQFKKDIFDKFIAQRLILPRKTVDVIVDSHGNCQIEG